MRFVPVKDEEQQANSVVFRARIFWCVSARGASMLCAVTSPNTATSFARALRAATLIAHVEDPNSSLPESARVVLRLLIDTFAALQAQIKELDGEINRRSRADAVAPRLMTIPGVGPIGATANHGTRASSRVFPSRTRFRRLARSQPT
jgi:transposase